MKDECVYLQIKTLSRKDFSVSHGLAYQLIYTNTRDVYDACGRTYLINSYGFIKGGLM